MARRLLTEAVARLAAEGGPFLTTQDIEHRLGLNARRAYGLAHRLVAAGLLRRVRRGLYAIVPPEDWWDRGTTGISWYRAAAEAVRGDPYYLGYYTAMEIHGMLQHPVRTVFVAAPRFHRGFRIGPATVRYVKLAPERLFGEEDRRLDGDVLKVSRLERTFIDCVDRPELCGGIEEVVRGFLRRSRDLDPDRLLRYAHRFDRPVVMKRLGYLLELVGHPDRELIWELEQAAGRLGRYVPLDKTKPVGEADARDARWELVLNIDPQGLLRGART